MGKFTYKVKDSQSQKQTNKQTEWVSLYRQELELTEWEINVVCAECTYSTLFFDNIKLER